jgi:MSHA pilin protein MshC
MHAARGYTMVELIMVLVVMGVLAAVAAPRLMDRQGLNERGFQDQLLGVLRYSRKLAITQQREVCVQLQPGGAPTVNVVYAATGVACNAAAPVAEPGTSQNWVLPLPPQVTLSGATLVRYAATGRLVPYVDVNFAVGANAALTVNRETGLAR